MDLLAFVLLFMIMGGALYVLLSARITKVVKAHYNHSFTTKLQKHQEYISEVTEQYFQILGEKIQELSGQLERADKTIQKLEEMKKISSSILSDFSHEIDRIDIDQLNHEKEKEPDLAAPDSLQTSSSTSESFPTSKMSQSPQTSKPIPKKNNPNVSSPTWDSEAGISISEKLDTLSLPFPKGVNVKKAVNPYAETEKMGIVPNVPSEPEGGVLKTLGKVFKGVLGATSFEEYSNQALSSKETVKVAEPKKRFDLKMDREYPEFVPETPKTETILNEEYANPILPGKGSNIEEALRELPPTVLKIDKVRLLLEKGFSAKVIAEATGIEIPEITLIKTIYVDRRK